ncbi:uncharacterized protein N7479_005385 [Penicillium vulpinum]|uniref:Uncharacterized protein n=1 Tax=Penicillium vulpinum TaxID=29845 RepID=A0A1V6RKY4_9EURO|nr:uncharacterized protein N7479_005385 [Penicillium vulpinum]KAJ5958235.1 hypothetical protein N7479_005385 [Penicillium vulpinum]OQE02210.1 hypothetical protein PENVUL_c040G07269 [Penicillium vulpinum]
MDFIKQAVSSASGHKENKPTENNTQQNDDYVDKAFAAGVKKSGYSLDRNMQEKITDGAREAYEKATGKHVSEKISN